MQPKGIAHIEHLPNIYQALAPTQEKNITNTRKNLQQFVQFAILRKIHELIHFQS
jgi:hypothetical protein